jgi:hypothetical protein
MLVPILPIQAQPLPRCCEVRISMWYGFAPNLGFGSSSPHPSEWKDPTINVRPNNLRHARSPINQAFCLLIAMSALPAKADIR